jgi:hypothetical protein
LLGVTEVGAVVATTYDSATAGGLVWRHGVGVRREQQKTAGIGVEVWGAAYSTVLLCTVLVDLARARRRSAAKDMAGRGLSSSSLNLKKMRLIPNKQKNLELRVQNERFHASFSGQTLFFYLTTLQTRTL